MITLISTALMTSVLMFMTKKTNPVKMSVLVVIFSALAFWQMHKITGTTWFPLIFFLLFMGGIIMMFMILSSVSPNEKPLSVWKTVTVLTFFVAATASPALVASSQSTCSMKWFMLNSMNLYLMMVLILTYFFSFLCTVSSEEGPLRTSVYC